MLLTTTQMWYKNFEVHPELFDYHQAMEKRSYQYKIFMLENLLLLYLPLL